MSKQVMEALDDAVSAYVATLGNGQVLSGWVLSFQVSSLTADPDMMPLGFASSHTMSPSTSGELAIGLLALTQSKITNYLKNENY